MFSTCSVYNAASLLMLTVALIPRISEPQKAVQRQIRVCADPNNLPFSNEHEQGFENELARLIARDLGASVRYYWWPQRRGFIRNTLNAGLCDVVMGVPAQYEQSGTTRPYYRSTYVFVTRSDRQLRITSLDDKRLLHLRIGIHAIGDDYSNIPPAEALARRGLTRNIRGYSIYGDYSEQNPPARLIDAVVRGEVDVAIAWGPLAGYFAQRASTPLDISILAPDAFSFDIAMGVRRDDDALKHTLDRVLSARTIEIRQLLQKYGVPLAELPTKRPRGI